MSKHLHLTFLVVVIMLFGSAVAMGQVPSVVWQKTYGDPVNQEFTYASVKLGPDLYVHAGRNIVPLNAGEALLLFTRANGDSLYTRIINNFTLGKILGLAANDDGTFVATGTCYLGPGINGIFLMKFNQLGSVIWQKSYIISRGSNNQKVIRVPDGYLLIGAALFDIIKTDLDGNLLWRKSYGAPDSGGQNLTLLPDGSYLAIGWTVQGSSASVSAFHMLNYWLLKLRPNGDTIFTKIIGNPGNYEIGYAAAPTADGGVAVAGAYVANVPQTKRQGQILKLDSLLNLQWEMKVMPKSGDYELGCEFYNIQPTINGGIIASGYNSDSIGPNGSVLMVNSSGAKQWEQQYVRNSIAEKFYSMLYEDDGTAVFTGTKGGYYSGSNVVFDMYMLKLQNMPLPYRSNFCASPPQAHFSSLVRPDSVIFTNAQTSASGLRYGVVSKWEYLFGDGSNFITYAAAEARRVAHRYTVPAPLLHGIPVKLVVTNNLFCTDTLTLYPFGGAPTGLTEATASRVEVKTYPQPMRQGAMLELKNYQGTEKLQLQVTDLLGRTVQMPQQQLQAGRWQLQKGSLSTGLYLYRIVTTSKVVAQGKLLVQ